MVASVADWPVVAAGCPPDTPAVVVAANRVVAATSAARAEGVRPGLRRREAQGRCPELVVIAADPGRDARSWEPVVAAVESTLTPGVEVLAPGTLALATRGPSRYFGGDGALGARVVSVVDGTVGQQACRVGIADGLFAAGLGAVVAGAGGDRVVVVEPGGSRKWLSPHPVGVLGPDFEALTGLLVRLGIRTLGDLAGLPGPSVLGRFGVEGATAHRLARGLDARPVAARTPPPDLVVTAELDPPEARVEAAAFVAKALADELQARLGAAGLACTKVAIEVETEHGERLVRHWRHEGTLTAAALSERARWQLDGWLARGSVGQGDGAGPGDGEGGEGWGGGGGGEGGGGGSGGGGGPTAGLTLLRLTPEEVRPDHGRQLGFWGGSADADARAARALARVQGLLGPEAVVTAVLQGGRGHAEQVRLVPWGDAREEVDDGRDRRRDRADGRPPWPGRLASPSPTTVHESPRPAEVVDAAGEPVVVTGRGLISAAPATVSIGGGRRSAVVAWAGPWPLEERWWEGGGRRRARLQVVVEGGEALLLAREGGSWWVEGTYS